MIPQEYRIHRLDKLNRQSFRYIARDMFRPMHVFMAGGSEDTPIPSIVGLKVANQAVFDGSICQYHTAKWHRSMLDVDTLLGYRGDLPPVNFEPNPLPMPRMSRQEDLIVSVDEPLDDSLVFLCGGFIYLLN